jgi:hypothetical protein
MPERTPQDWAPWNTNSTPPASRSAYRPLNTGGRFSANARWPSW